MKFGANTFIWVSPCTTKAVKKLIPKVKKMGFVILEIAVDNPDLIDFRVVNELLNDSKLEGLICGVFGRDRNICSDDPSIRANAKAYLRRIIDASYEIGSGLVCGPMYSSVGKDHLKDEKSRMIEWNLSVSGIQEIADYAAVGGVNLALEPINRFKSDMINIAAQGNKFILDVGRKNVGLLLDTFHMHIEEKSSAEAIRETRDRLFHFHASENDRGIPGTGQVRWQEISQALNDVHYNGPVVIESFTLSVKENIQSGCLWRQTAPDDDTIAQEGLHFLQTLFT